MRYLKILPILVLIFWQARSPSSTALPPQQPQPAAPQRQPFLLRVTFGHGNVPVERWSGTITVQDAQVTTVKVWKLRGRDRISLNEFELQTQNPNTGAAVVKGLTLLGEAGPNGSLAFATNQGSFALRIGEFRLGEVKELLGGAVRATRLQDAVRLTDGTRADDYPSIAVAPDGTAWAVWQSYSGQSDQIRFSKHDTQWRTFTPVPGGAGDLWRPQVALDRQARPWIAWSQQVSGNFDLYARPLDAANNTWQGLFRLTSDPGSDIDHHFVSDSRGGLWVVWQGFRGANSDIFLRHYEGARWSEEVRVTDDPANDWEPRVAVDAKGRAHVVWDTYRNGNYDVYMRVFDGGRLGPETPVANTPLFEAHASVAVDSQDRVWVAWNEGGVNWGKDTGPTDDPHFADHPRQAWDDWIMKAAAPGTRLYDSRRINLTVFENGRRTVPAQDLRSALAAAGITSHDYPQLLSHAPTGRMGLLFHAWTLEGEFSKGMESRQIAVWEQAWICYEGDRWSPVTILPESAGRPSMRASVAMAPDGGVWAAWPTDGRASPTPYQPNGGNIYAAHLPARPAPGAFALRPWSEGEAVQVPAVHLTEKADLAGIRSYRTTVGGRENRIVRGDFHRHTEFSWDNGGLRDGSLFDFYRYMLDAAGMDFGAVTDHNSGGDFEYWWWLVEKSCDMYQQPRAFNTFYAYERSVQYPGGHRNVFHTRRGVPVVSFFTETGFNLPRPGIAAMPNRLAKNDTKLLYEALRLSGGISIPHTTGSNAGTDWQDNDPEVEPAVEIYQGARLSYEHPGAPRAVKTGQEIPDFREPGFVWNAYRKGYRLGTIASSDHFSTHISYALVFTEQPTREAIFEGIKKRHTYGATDNIVLDYRMGGHFMGDEFDASSIPPLNARIVGTAPVARVDLIRNEKVIYTVTPNRKEVAFTFRDEEPVPGRSYYYLRLVQQDAEMAWGSPIWVTLRR